MKNIVILGSTGSIGRQALDVIERYPDEFRVVGLSAHSNDALLAEQAAVLPVMPRTVLGSAAGTEGILELCRMPEADTVINALVGSAGLRPTLESLETGKQLLLANKESMVVGGELVNKAAAANGRPIIPIDSEHSAIFQCLNGENTEDVRRLIITASGGPFRGKSRRELAEVTMEDALAHPRWTMGPKITIDSSTMMNKGLEVIEAHYLFGLEYDAIHVVVHPQSIVHSLVEFVDGSMIAQLGPTDMRVPIQYALTYPRRKPAPAGFADLVEHSRLTFEKTDDETFPCLSYAIDAGKRGGAYPAVINAANEEAVAAFLKGEIGYPDIAELIEDALLAYKPGAAATVEDLEAAEGWARQRARTAIEAKARGRS